mmetsp:Transcript_53906/g.60234  ORF Transcript_53906/g.60234 Transcript_53906/m.60234 type:complete len:86 (+) Transcript_53906:55-312(+)
MSCHVETFLCCFKLCGLYTLQSVIYNKISHFHMHMHHISFVIVVDAIICGGGDTGSVYRSNRCFSSLSFIRLLESRLPISHHVKP